MANMRGSVDIGDTSGDVKLIVHVNVYSFLLSHCLLKNPRGEGVGFISFVRARTSGLIRLDSHAHGDRFEFYYHLFDYTFIDGFLATVFDQ